MSSSAPQTVRDAFFDVLRQYELTTVFANPGSTEISLLTNLPADIDFTLALHEGSVVGMATGYALARQKAAFGDGALIGSFLTIAAAELAIRMYDSKYADTKKS